MKKQELEEMLESIIEKKMAEVVKEQVERTVRNMFESGLISTIIKETAAGVAAGLMLERKQPQISIPQMQMPQMMPQRPEESAQILQSFAAQQQTFQPISETKKTEDAKRAFAEYQRSLQEQRGEFGIPQQQAYQPAYQQPSQKPPIQDDPNTLSNPTAIRTALMAESVGTISAAAPRGVELSDFKKLMREASKKPKIVMSQG